MTKNEINYVLNKIGINPNVIIDASDDIKYISFLQSKTFFPMRLTNRICFDTGNEVLKIYHCDKTDLKQFPAGWIEKKDGDTIDGTVYKYLTDIDTGMPVADIYDFSAIAAIGTI